MRMMPDVNQITISDNLAKIERFIADIIISPRHSLRSWAAITKQTPAAKIGYIGQHLASLITGVPGTGSGARGDDLADGSEVKSCNKVDQVDKCKNCGARVLRMEDKCSVCGSKDIARKDDSKWLFSVRDRHELLQYFTLDRVILLLMDYPGFDNGDYSDIRITAFEVYPKDKRMRLFKWLLANHYFNMYVPKLNKNEKTNPMNLHPWSFQFYKCNPIKTFECTIKDIDSSPVIYIDRNSYVEPDKDRDETLQPVPMPSSLLRPGEWKEMLDKADFDTEIAPLLDVRFLEEKGIAALSKDDFVKFDMADKIGALPFLDRRLRDYISLRDVKSVRQKAHYQRKKP